MNPTNPYFMNQASDLAHSHISVDLFVFSQGRSYKNLVTFADLAKYSCGNLYFYPDFNAKNHSFKFSNELYHCLTRRTAWEAVFRIRISTGFRQIGTYGNVTIKAKTPDLVLCPVVDQ